VLFILIPMTWLMVVTVVMAASRTAALGEAVTTEHGLATRRAATVPGAAVGYERPSRSYALPRRRRARERDRVAIPWELGERAMAYMTIRTNADEDTMTLLEGAAQRPRERVFVGT